MNIEIKESGGSAFLIIAIIGKEDSEGWLKASVAFKYLGFVVDFDMSLMVNDLFSFRDGLAKLNSTLITPARFKNIEGDVDLLFQPDGLGHFSVIGKLSHPNVMDLETAFSIESDQTFIRPLLNEINFVLDNYRSLN